MAGDRQQFERATKKWEQLQADRAFSKPVELGRIAIVCSYFDNIAYGENKNEVHSEIRAKRDVKLFRKEALKLADMTIAEGSAVEVILNAQANDLRDVFRDPKIAEVITIGHGSLSTFWINDETTDDTYDWRTAAEDADHLKTGTFTQRHCGVFSRRLSVPLGTFTVADHRNIIAARGSDFRPKGLFHPENSLLCQVSPLYQLTYEYITSNYRIVEEPTAVTS